MVFFIPPLCSTTFQKCWHFLPPFCSFGGTFCHHFHVLTALSATTLFSSRFEWQRFLPSFCHFGGAFCPHFGILTALSATTFLEYILVKLHYHICKNNLLSQHPSLCPKLQLFCERTSIFRFMLFQP